MDTDLRASLIASGAAAILSMLVGVISGVGFLAIVLRALAGGIVFGAVVYGAFFLFRRFLPEMFSSGDGAETGEPVVGGTVDIVLQGEGPEETLGAGQGLTDLDSAAIGTGTDLEAGLASNLVGTPEPAQQRSARSPVPPAPARGRQPAVLAAEEEEAEDVSPFAGESLIDGDGSEEGEAEAFPQPQPSARASLARSSDGLDDLDVLPDLESLSEGFPSSMGGGGPAPAHEFPESDHRPSDGGRRGDTDPAMLAQAVRTLLKRDQER